MYLQLVHNPIHSNLVSTPKRLASAVELLANSVMETLYAYAHELCPTFHNYNYIVTTFMLDYI
jgi:hypothetical protein